MSGNKIGGWILIVLGAAFLASNLGWISFASLWKFWPIVLIVLGMSMILTRK